MLEGRGYHRQAGRRTHRSGRHGDWLKVKRYAPQEFVIGGYTTVKNRGFSLGSLLLGDQRHGALAYVGRVGIGWDRRTAEKAHNALRPLQHARSPFVRMPVAVRHWARCARPRLVAEVRLQTWSEHGLLRHASFRGLGENRASAAVIREED